MTNRPVKGRPDAARPYRLSGAAAVAWLFLAAGGGCGEGLRQSQDEVGTSRRIGPTGGRVDFAEAHLEVLPGAIDRDLSLSVRRVAARTGATVGDGFAFGPNDFTFSLPASIAIDLPSAPAVDVGRLALAGQAGSIWRRIAGSAVTPDGRQVGGAVTQLVTFAVVVTCGSNDDCASGSCDTGVCQAPAGP